MSNICPSCGRDNLPNDKKCYNCEFDLSGVTSPHQTSFSNQNQNIQLPEPKVSYPDPPPNINIQLPEPKVSYPDPPPNINIQLPEPKVSYPDPPPNINIQLPEPKVSYPDPPPNINIQLPEPKVSYPDPPPNINIQLPEPKVSYPNSPNIKKSSTMNITCPQCGHKENPPSTQYCDICGYEFTSAPVEQVPPSAPSQIEQTPPPSYPYYVETPATKIQVSEPQPNFNSSPPVASMNTARLINKQVGSPTSEFILEESNIIGRFDPDSGPVEIDLDGFPGVDYISRNHAEIYREGGLWKIKDLGSENGVFVKRVNQSRFSPRITTPEILNPGDEVAFGKIRFVFQSP
jgi:pSer/pThr/pTyr-binding forkhead associated (FHA) protein